MLGEARGVLNDRITPYRYSDQDLVDAFNDALIQARTKRPDLFLGMGLRNTVPMYDATDTDTPFPIDASAYPAFLYYVVGRSELRDDGVTQEGRAVVLMNKFVSQLMQIMS